MKKKGIYAVIFLTAIILKSCYSEQPVSVNADFSIIVEDEDYSVPVNVLLENKSVGADRYLWTFEGGEPATSSSRQPGMVRYVTAGTYIIRLEAWNNDERKSKEFVLHLDSTVNAGFSIEIPVNNIMPAQAVITNHSTGGTSYRWVFEGASVGESELRNPPPVEFVRAGEHKITLDVSNGRETFTVSKTVTILPAMSLDFKIVPAFENEDMEAPFTAMLINQSVNGVRYRWSSENGQMDDSSSADSVSVTYSLPGTYIITLEADNGKEVKTVSRTVTVKPNTNLYIMQDVRLGIKSAHAGIGCFYSCNLRRVIAKDDINMENSRLIDFVFFGSDETFSYCKIISPDSAGYYAFYDIPEAGHTATVNVLENTDISFTANDFDSMTDDSILQKLPIVENSFDNTYFTAASVPRIVLFETHDGRRGAVKIRNFVSRGQESYILADIKVQKLKNSD
ncbi:MAG: PKD domain-containing protein [Prevotellaceae bacterium]|nr:PKD domain-containing protein [Prevotellaceae bacterium]